jgi:hypothetical protein
MRSDRTVRLSGAKFIVQGLGLLGFCTGIGCAAVAQQAGSPLMEDRPKPAYAVEGLALGDTVQRDNPSYRAYHCSPSEQFAGFTWCTKTSTPRTLRGLVYSSSSILHSTDGTIVYANKTLEPTLSSSADAQEQIQQIAQKYGAQPRIIEMPHRSGFPDGVIAVWGDVVLQPIDTDCLSQLAAGKAPQVGFMVDFIADFQRSAKNGLPIYRIGGSAGSVWAASYGQPDRGTVRFIAVDASRFGSSTDQTLMVAQSSPHPDQTTIVAQQPLAPDQAAQPSPPLNDKENESQTSIAELKLTISLLKAELATSTAKIARLENQVSETCPDSGQWTDGTQTAPRTRSR